jgi:hypothetical protein
MTEAEKLEQLWVELQAAIKAHRDALIARDLAEWRYSRQRRLVVEMQEEERRRSLGAAIMPQPALNREPDGDVLWA